MNALTFASGSGRTDSDCEQRLESLGMVAEGVAHDFNNILATISGFAELILSGEGPSPQPTGNTARFARHILEAAMAGQSSVRELRTFARCGADAESAPLDLHEVIGQTLDICRVSLGGAIRVRTEFAPLPARLEGCRGLLQNAFLNLFINARDAMPRGGTLSIRTSIPEKRDSASPCLVVSVRDTGMGMTREVRARLFERYFTTKGEKGNGLGLAQVRDTVRRHGGWIGVDSEPGEGAEFRLYFPLARG